MAENKAYGQITIVDIQDGEGGSGGGPNLLKDTQAMRIDGANAKWSVPALNALKTEEGEQTEEYLNKYRQLMVPNLFNGAFQQINLIEGDVIYSSEINILPEYETKAACFSCYLNCEEIGELPNNDVKVTFNCIFSEGTQEDQHIYSEIAYLFKDGIFVAKEDGGNPTSNEVSRIYFSIEETFFSHAREKYPDEEIQCVQLVIARERSEWSSIESNSFVFFAPKLELSETPSAWNKHPDDVAFTLAEATEKALETISPLIMNEVDKAIEETESSTTSQFDTLKELLVAAGVLVKHETSGGFSSTVVVTENNYELIQDSVERDINEIVSKLNTFAYDGLSSDEIVQFQNWMKERGYLTESDTETLVSQMIHNDKGLTVLKTNVADLATQLTNINTVVSDLSEKNQWVHVGESGLIIGSSTDSGILHATNNKLEVRNVHATEVYFGNWAWMPGEDGTSISLRYFESVQED